MQQLIERYLHAVKSWMPEKLQAEFLPELEDDLRSQIDESERTLGRKLDEKEVAEILKKRGHPMLVATRLMPQQHLIGPAWYPIWRFALRAVIVWILAPVFVLILAPLAALSSSDPFGAFVGVVLKLPVAALYAMGVITGIVAVWERLQLKIKPFESWDPAHLPPPPVDPNNERFSRTESIIEMATGMLFLLWWIGVIKGPNTAEISIQGGPIWTALFWPILLVTATSVAQSTYKLLRPYWRPWYSALNLASQCAVITIAIILLNADPLISVSGPDGAGAKVEKLASVLHGTIMIGLTVAAIVAAANLFAEVRRLIRSRKQVRKVALQAVAL